jgi:hypothetical protein
MAEKEYPDMPVRELVEEGVTNGEMAPATIEDRYGHVKRR